MHIHFSGHTIGELRQREPTESTTVRAAVAVGLGHQVGGQVERLQGNLHLLQLQLDKFR